jgi:hypothetical protein
MNCIGVFASDHLCSTFGIAHEVRVGHSILLLTLDEDQSSMKDCRKICLTLP